MFKYILLFALIAFAAAEDSDVHAEIKILTSDVRPDGFDYAVDTSNGIAAVATGDEHGNIHGEYHWETKDGPIKITYVADENGYQPIGDSLPTPPPTPEAILKALAYIAAHTSKDA